MRQANQPDSTRVPSAHGQVQPPQQSASHNTYTALLFPSADSPSTGASAAGPFESYGRGGQEQGGSHGPVLSHSSAATSATTAAASAAAAASGISASPTTKPLHPGICTGTFRGSEAAQLFQAEQWAYLRSAAAIDNPDAGVDDTGASRAAGNTADQGRSTDAQKHRKVSTPRNTAAAASDAAKKAQKEKNLEGEDVHYPNVTSIHPRSYAAGFGSAARQQRIAASNAESLVDAKMPRAET